MPLLQTEGMTLKLVKPTNFKIEKELQILIEKNLETVFSCKFIVSEFPTGSEHAGRIDTLALSEDCNPVIIEYKKVESSELVNQSLYYLSWLNDHRGDYEVIAKKALGPNIEIDWSSIRVICLAPGFKKFDLHAVKMMGANIELWHYRLFENNLILLEEVYKRSTALLGNLGTPVEWKNPVMVAAGRKGMLTRASGSYTFDQHLENGDEAVKRIAQDVRDFILSLDEAVEEAPKKFYVAYRMAQNFVCMEVKRQKVILFLKLNPSEMPSFPPNTRDVSKIGHYGTGDFEITLKSQEDLIIAQEYIRLAFEKVGG